MKQEVFVNGVHEYDYEFREEGQNMIHSLYRNHSAIWREDVQGEGLLRIVDDGHGLAFSSKPFSQVDYDQAIHLRILLGIIYRDEDFELIWRKEQL